MSAETQLRYQWSYYSLALSNQVSHEIVHYPRKVNVKPTHAIDDDLYIYIIHIVIKV